MNSSQAKHSVIDTTAFAATVVSTLGLLGLVMGRILGAKGFSSVTATPVRLAMPAYRLALALLVAVITGASRGSPAADPGGPAV